MNGNVFNPTPIQFFYSFRKLFSIKYYTANKTGNCERDNADILINITNFKENCMDIEPNNNTDDFIEPILLDDHDYREMDVNEHDVF